MPFFVRDNPSPWNVAGPSAGRALGWFLRTVGGRQNRQAAMEELAALPTGVDPVQYQNQVGIVLGRYGLTPGAHTQNLVRTQAAMWERGANADVVATERERAATGLRGLADRFLVPQVQMPDLAPTRENARTLTTLTNARNQKLDALEQAARDGYGKEALGLLAPKEEHDPKGRFKEVAQNGRVFTLDTWTGNVVDSGFSAPKAPEFGASGGMVYNKGTGDVVRESPADAGKTGTWTTKEIGGELYKVNTVTGEVSATDFSAGAAGKEVSTVQKYDNGSLIVFKDGSTKWEGAQDGMVNPTLPQVQRLNDNTVIATYPDGQIATMNVGEDDTVVFNGRRVPVDLLTNEGKNAVLQETYGFPAPEKTGSDRDSLIAFQRQRDELLALPTRTPLQERKLAEVEAAIASRTSKPITITTVAADGSSKQEVVNLAEVLVQEAMGARGDKKPGVLATGTKARPAVMPAVRAKAQQRVADVNEMLTGLKQAEELFDPTFLSWESGVKAWVLNKYGRYDPKYEDEYLSKMMQFRGSVQRAFDAYRRAVTGMQAAEKELDRLQRSFLSGSMSPVQFMANMQTIVANARGVQTEALRINEGDVQGFEGGFGWENADEAPGGGARDYRGLWE